MHQAPWVFVFGSIAWLGDVESVDDEIDLWITGDGGVGPGDQRGWDVRLFEAVGSAHPDGAGAGNGPESHGRCAFGTEGGGSGGGSGR